MSSSIYSPHAVIMAPLSGYTDLPYRRSLRRHGCRYAFTEMIDAGSLAYCNPNASIMLTRGKDESWLGVQLVGADADMLRKSVEAINSYDFNIIDFNLGCPVPKVAKKGAGAVLGRQIDTAASLLEMIVKLSKFPVTAKTRIYDESSPEMSVKLAKALENAGAQVLTFHGRIKEKIYSGPVYHEIIAAVRESVRIPVVVNGGINSRTAWEYAVSASHCELAMVARGAMGNPWLFREINDSGFQGPTVHELAEEIHIHVGEMLSFYGKELGYKLARKIVLDYLRGRGYSGELRSRVSFLKSDEDLANILNQVRSGPAERYWQTPVAERRLNSLS